MNKKILKFILAPISLLAVITPISFNLNSSIPHVNKVIGSHQKKSIAYIYEGKIYKSKTEIFRLFLLKNPNFISQIKVLGDIDLAKTDYDDGLLNKALLPNYNLDSISPIYLSSTNRKIYNFVDAKNTLVNPSLILKRYTDGFGGYFKYQKDAWDSYRSKIQIGKISTFNLDTLRAGKQWYNPLSREDFNDFSKNSSKYIKENLYLPKDYKRVWLAENDQQITSLNQIIPGFREEISDKMAIAYDKHLQQVQYESDVNENGIDVEAKYAGITPGNKDLNNTELYIKTSPESIEDYYNANKVKIDEIIKARNSFYDKSNYFNRIFSSEYNQNKQSVKLSNSSPWKFYKYGDHVRKNFDREYWVKTDYKKGSHEFGRGHNIVFVFEIKSMKYGRYFEKSFQDKVIKNINSETDPSSAKLTLRPKNFTPSIEGLFEISLLDTYVDGEPTWKADLNYKNIFNKSIKEMIFSDEERKKYGNGNIDRLKIKLNNYTIRFKYDGSHESRINWDTEMKVKWIDSNLKHTSNWTIEYDPRENEALQVSPSNWFVTKKDYLELKKASSLNHLSLMNDLKKRLILRMKVGKYSSTNDYNYLGQKIKNKMNDYSNWSVDKNDEKVINYNSIRLVDNGSINNSYLTASIDYKSHKGNRVEFDSSEFYIKIPLVEKRDFDEELKIANHERYLISKLYNSSNNSFKEYNQSINNYGGNLIDPKIDLFNRKLILSSKEFKNLVTTIDQGQKINNSSSSTWNKNEPVLYLKRKLKSPNNIINISGVGDKKLLDGIKNKVNLKEEFVIEPFKLDFTKLLNNPNFINLMDRVNEKENLKIIFDFSKAYIDNAEGTIRGLKINWDLKRKYPDYRKELPKSTSMKDLIEKDMSINQLNDLLKYYKKESTLNLSTEINFEIENLIKKLNKQNKFIKEVILFKDKPLWKITRNHNTSWGGNTNITGVEYIKYNDYTWSDFASILNNDGKFILKFIKSLKNKDTPSFKTLLKELEFKIPKTNIQKLAFNYLTTLKSFVYGKSLIPKLPNEDNFEFIDINKVIIPESENVETMLYLINRAEKFNANTTISGSINGIKSLFKNNQEGFNKITELIKRVSEMFIPPLMTQLFDIDGKKFNISKRWAYMYDNEDIILTNAYIRSIPKMDNNYIHYKGINQPILNQVSTIYTARIDKIDYYFENYDYVKAFILRMLLSKIKIVEGALYD